MSGSRTTRKVTIDSGRRVSTSSEVVDQSSGTKSKSVFDRLGVITAKSVVSPFICISLMFVMIQSSDNFNFLV